MFLDFVYEVDVEVVVFVLKVCGVCCVYMVGKLGEWEVVYWDVGVDIFVFVGCDILNFLREVYVVLGIEV